MNILDTFILLFKADTTDLKKGSQEATKTQEQLQNKIKLTNEDTLGLGVSFLDLATKAAAALGVVVGVGAAVSSIFKSDQAELNIARVGKAIGANTQDLEVWERGIKDVAGEGATIIPVIQKLTSELNRLKNFGGGSIGTNPMTAFLTNLNVQGVKLSDDPFQLLLNEADRIDQFKKQLKEQGKSNEEIERAVFAFSTDTLGNDLNTTILLTQGKQALVDQLVQIRERGVPTDEENKRLLEFAKNYGFLKQKIIDLGVKVSSPILPTLGYLIGGKSILDYFNEWKDSKFSLSSIIGDGSKIKEIQEDFAIFFGKIKGWANDVVGIFKDLFGWFGKIIKAVEAFSSSGTIKERVKRFKAVYSGDNSDKKSEDSSVTPTKEGHAQIDEYNQQETIYRAAMALRGASSSPISAQTNNSVVNGPRLNSSNSVKIDTINVQTQASDASGIAGSIEQGMSAHFSKTIMQWADGVLG